MALERDEIAFHQVLTFAPEPFSLGEALLESPLFHVQIRDRGAQAEWIQFCAEEGPSPFPLGRVTLHEQGILLETFNEDRTGVLRERVNSLGSWQVTLDQVRLFQVQDAIGVACHPSEWLSRGGAHEDRIVVRTQPTAVLAGHQGAVVIHRVGQADCAWCTGLRIVEARDTCGYCGAELPTPDVAVEGQASSGVENVASAAAGIDELATRLERLPEWARSLLTNSFSFYLGIAWTWKSFRN